MWVLKSNVSGNDDGTSSNAASNRVLKFNDKKKPGQVGLDRVMVYHLCVMSLLALTKNNEKLNSI